MKRQRSYAAPRRRAEASAALVASALLAEATANLSRCRELGPGTPRPSADAVWLAFGVAQRRYGPWQVRVVRTDCPHGTHGGHVVASLWHPSIDELLRADKAAEAVRLGSAIIIALGSPSLDSLPATGRDEDGIVFTWTTGSIPCASA